MYKLFFFAIALFFFSCQEEKKEPEFKLSPETIRLLTEKKEPEFKLSPETIRLLTEKKEPEFKLSPETIRLLTEKKEPEFKLSPETINRYFSSLKIEKPSVAASKENPISGLTIRFDDKYDAIIKSSKKSIEGTTRNSNGAYISQLKFPLTNTSNSYSTNLASMNTDKALISANLVNIYSEYIPQNAKLLAIHNKIDRTEFEFLEKGVLKIRSIKLRDGRMIALVGTLWATYELLGGENEIKKYMNN